MKSKIDSLENIDVEENKNLDDRQLSEEMIDQVSGGHIIIIINLCPSAIM